MSILTSCPELQKKPINITELLDEELGSVWHGKDDPWNKLLKKDRKERAKYLGFEEISINERNNAVYEWLLEQLGQNAYPTWEQLKKVDLHKHEDKVAIEQIALGITCRLSALFRENIKGTTLEEDLLQEMKTTEFKTEWDKPDLDEDHPYVSLLPLIEEYFQNEDLLEAYIRKFLYEEIDIP